MSVIAITKKINPGNGLENGLFEISRHLSYR